MDRFRLLIRADATAALGTGHVMRCIALAQAWRAATGGEPVFASAGELAPGLRARVETAGGRVCTLGPVVPGGADDRAAFCRLIRALRPQRVVVDCYAVDEAYQRGVTEAGVPFLMLDDHRNQVAFCSDWVLNQNLHASEAFYASVRGAPRYLLGPRHALLRREFVERGAPQRDPARRVRELLVTPGGSDPHNVTELCVAAVAKLGDFGLHTTAVLGPSVADADAVAARLRGLLPPARLTVARDVRDMYPLMARADVAITAAGSTTLETSFMGLPSLWVVVADNQVDQAEAAAAAGMAELLGAAPGLTPESVARALEALLQDPDRRAAYARRSQLACDGRGAERVVRSMLDDGRAS